MEAGERPVRPRSWSPVAVAMNAALPSAVSCDAPPPTATLTSHQQLVLLLNKHLHMGGSKKPGAAADARQPEGVHVLRKAGVPNKPRSAAQFGGGTSKPQMGFGGPSRTRHPPPPNRGLPCISLAAQRDAENNSIRAQESSYSRLPKPKSH